MGNRIRSGSVVAAGAVLLAACNPLARPSLNAYRPLQEKGVAAAPDGDLTIRFGGTSTLVFSDGRERIMIDGFFSRPSTLPMILAPLRTNDERVTRDLEELQVPLRAKGGEPTVRALFIAHSHHDHAMDSARIAQLTGARLIGSESSKHVVGDPPLFRALTEPGEKPFRLRQFCVTVVPTPHSPKDFGLLKGEVRSSLERPRWLGDYRASTSHAYFIEHFESGRRILVVPSANHDPGKPNPFAAFRPDMVFLAVAKVGRKKVAWGQQYWQRTVKETEAKWVVGIHWDDIRRPLSKPFKTIPRAQDRFHRGMRILMPLALRDDVTLRLPIAYKPVELWPLLPVRPEDGLAASRCKSEPLA